VTVDGAGNLYIADTKNDRIRKVTASTGIIGTVAATDTRSDSGDGVQLQIPDSAGVPPSASLAQDLAGHYYLGGVTEVGSELLLKSDGTFQWMLTYGAIDQSASGHWHRSGDTIVLDADQPKATGKLYSFDIALPWDAAAEEALRASQVRVAEDEIERRCSFLYPSYPSDMPTHSVDYKLPKAGLERQAHESLDRLATLTTAVEQTANAAVAACHTVNDRRAALLRAVDAYQAANLPMPKLTPPATPAACAFPTVTAPVDRADPSSWRPGLAVNIRTKDSAERLNGIPVTFVFADGEQIKRSTDEHGYATIARDDTASLRAIAIERPEANLPSEEIALNPSRDRVFNIQLDRTAIIDVPPFDHLVLQVEGSNLVSEKIGGSYSRQ